jgi:hypothetical protein
MSDSEHHKSPADTLLTALVVALSTSLAGTIVYLLAYMGRPIIDAIATHSTKEFVLRLSALLVFALLVAVSWAFRLRSQIKKPLSSKFDFDDYGGYYIDRKTGRGVCTRCLSEGQVIHLMPLAGPHQPRICNACRTSYRGKPQKAA